MCCKKYADTPHSSWQHCGECGCVMLPGILKQLTCWGTVSLELVHLHLTVHWCLWTQFCFLLFLIAFFSLGLHGRDNWACFGESLEGQQISLVWIQLCQEAVRALFFLPEQYLMWVIDKRDGLPLVISCVMLPNENHQTLYSMQEMGRNNVFGDGLW